MKQLIQKFNKYKEGGAYHWKQVERRLKKYNAGLAARYSISECMLIKNCHNPDTIIDIGCGDGVLTSRLTRQFRNSKVIGFDFDETAIRLANEETKKLSLPNLSFIYGDAFDHVKKTDLITATDVIEHLHNRNEFMVNCFNILNNNGSLFLSTPIRYKEFPDDKYHVYEFFYQELEDFSKSFGFSIAEHKSSHDYCFIERYSRIIKPMGIGRMRLYKYIYNMSALYSGKNVFVKEQCMLPTMQYILLKKHNK